MLQLFLRSPGARCRLLALVLGTCLPLAGQVIGPTIHTVSIDDGDNLHPGTNLTLRFTATDGSLPLQSATFGYTNSNGFYRAITTNLPATRTIVVPVTDDWPNGEYRLQSVTLQSALGASYFYAPSPSPFPSVSVPGAIAPPGPSSTLFLTRFVVSGARTYVPPKLTAITRTGDVAPGGTLIFRPTITPGSSSLRKVSLSINGPNGEFLSADSADGDPTQIALALPTNWFNGKYTVQAVFMSDAADQGIAYYRTGQINSVPGPVVHSVDFTAADFTLAGALDSYTFPTLQSFTLRTTEAKVGDTIAFDYTLALGTLPVRSVVFTLNGPIGGVRAVATAAGASGTATFVVPSSLVSGRYVLDRIDISDAGGYAAYYQSNRIVGYNPSRLKLPGPHSFQLASSAINVTGGIAPIPVIVTQPADVSVAPGGSAELKVEASSPVGWQVRWYEGASGDTGKPTIGNSSLFSVEATTDTMYWARVSNSYGSVDSRAALVSPRFTSPLPVVLTQPGNVTTSVNNNVLLGADVAGPGPLTLNWYKDGVAIPGATTTRLEFYPAQAAQSGTYYLVATNPQGSVTTNPVQVVVNDQPKILSQSPNRTARAGERVTFDVIATGGALAYDWGFSGYLIPALGSTFTIEKVNRNHAGQYSVGVRGDPFSHTVTATFDLTVIDPDLPLPVIVQPPDVLYTNVGAPFGFFVGAINDPQTYKVSSPLPPGVTWFDSEHHFLGPITQAGDYRVTFTVTNATGATTRTTTIHVFGQPFPPMFTTQPQSQTVYVDEQVSLSTEVLIWQVGFGLPPFTTYQWKKNGVPIQDARSPTLSFYAVRAGDAGVYTLEVSSANGTTVSAPATLTVLPALTPPTITAQPQSQVVKPGATVSFSIAATSPVALSYQWLRNGVAIPGATNATLRLDAVEAPQSGSYAVKVTNRAGTITSAPATLTLDEVVPGHLANLSVRSFTASGDRALIAGFATAGNRPKPVLARVIGPSLKQFGVTFAHPNPKLTLVSGTRTVDSNDDWASTNDKQPITEASKRVGAFALRDFDPDAGALLALDAGTYSIVAGTAVPASGIALIELYDTDETFGRVSSRLINVSARSLVGTGSEVLIAGFVVAGQTPCRVLVRGIGPSLASFGLGGVLAKPRLQIFGGPTLLGENTNWELQGTEIATTSAAVGAFPLRTGSGDAATVVTLPPGAYTAVLSGVGNTTGIGLLEIYAAP